MKQQSEDKKSAGNKDQKNDDLKRVAWMLERKNLGRSDFVPDYGDLSLLNRDGLILKMVGRELLQDIVSDYLDLLETSGAVYEYNGDYALGIFTSGWCKLMDSSSRKLCNTASNFEALESGKWLCHDSCWEDASIQCMQQEKPVDVPCAGGLRLYAVPVKAEGKVVGAINFGYGDPPSDEASLKELANKYDIPLQELYEQARTYKRRPPFIIDLAKQHIEKSAKYIGNIIERKLAEKVAMENEQKLRITLDSIGDAVIATDLQAQITLMNPEAERLCGCSLDQAKGMNLADVFRIVNALTGEKVENPIKKALQTGKVVGLANHTMLISKDGNEYQIADSASPIRDEQGNTSGAVLVFRDVTEEYMMREKLRQNEERLNFAMMVKNDGMWDWNLITNKSFFDHRYYTMAGYAPDEFPQTFKGWAQNVHPDDLQASKDAIKAYLNGESDKFNIEFRFRRKDGSWMWILGKGKIVEKDEKGTPARMVGTHTDITERKQAEKELQNSKQQLLTILNGSNAYVYIADMQTHEILFVNETGLKAWGKDIIGEKCYEALQGFDKPCSFCTNNRLIDENSQPTGIYAWEFQNNINKRWYDIRDSAISWTDGRLVRMEVVIDITDRKLSQQKIQESEERFQKMLALIPDMISIHDKDFNIIYSNWNGFAAVDEEKRRLHTKCYLTYRGLDEICSDCRVKEVLETKKAFQTEVALPDGTWIDLRVIPVLDNNGEIELIVEWVRDITVQKQTLKTQQIIYQIANEMVFTFHISELIKAIEQQLSQLVDTSNFYVALFDEQTGMLSAPFEKDEKDQIDTWPAERSASGLVIEKKQPVLLKKQDILRLIETGVIKQTGSICEAWLGMPLLRDNKVFGVIVVQSYDNSNAFDNNSKEILGYVSNQISLAIERTRVFEDLLRAKNKAEESDRLKSAFLANMSHEIRTPMNGIMGFAELLKNPQLSAEQQKKYIGVIEKSGVRMLGIINDIVDISRIEAGVMDVSLAESNINEQLDYIFNFFKPQVEAKGMQLVLSSVLQAKQATVVTDREKLFAVLTNLVKNAIKYAREGFIEYGCREKGSFLEFFVKDTGIGIPEDRQQAIFHRFVQADIEDIEARQGAGLGLAISKAYVEMLGGEIWVESEEGKGSTFYFTIPCDSHEEKRDTLDSNASNKIKEAQGKKLKVLIVEDDEISSELMEILLEPLAMETLKAFSGGEAVDLCMQHPDIDLILMDIKMPGMDGQEATRQIRQVNKNVVIIAQTAKALLGDKEMIVEAGFNDYIAKPVNKFELLQRINHHTRGLK